MRFKDKLLFSSFILLIYGGFSYAQTFENLNISSEEGLEILTWNIEWFPKSGTTTVGYVSDIIEGIDADLYAIQEIDDTTVFKNMVNQLDEFDYILMNGWFGGLVYVYKTSEIEILEAYEIYTESEYWQPLPRSPLVLKFLHQGEEVYAINNHFKCCGDNYINLNDNGDEEMRRLIASTLIEEYMREQLEGKRVILLGDLNDMIDEIEETNVFSPFLESTNLYWFADMDIALGPNSGWSYPTWPSHLDHIMVTDEMFEDLNDPTTSVSVIDVATEMGGWYYYEQYVSDHRPVSMSIRLNPLSIAETTNQNVKYVTHIYDLLGRDCVYEPSKILIYRYSDGSAERRISFSASQPE
tara:strand:- start:141 stop:1202 length:1062 start_codon:yes stop_codon:yes gene_type:complete